MDYIDDQIGIDTKNRRRLPVALDRTVGPLKLITPAAANGDGQDPLTNASMRVSELEWTVVEPQTTDSATAAGAADSTEKSQEREKLRQLETLINCSQEHMALINRDYVYETVNDAYCQARNQPRSELIGRTVADLWGKATFAEVLKTSLDRCFCGNGVNYQTWYVHSHLGKVFMDVSFHPYYDTAGAVSHVIVVSRNATEAARATESNQHFATRLEAVRSIDRNILLEQPLKATAVAALQQLRRLVPMLGARILMVEVEELSPLFVPELGQAMDAAQGTILGVATGERADGGDPARMQLLAELGMLHTEGSEAARRLSFPLRVRDRSVGLLVMETEDGQPLTQAQIEVVQHIAEQQALAIQHEWMRSTLSRYTNHLESLVALRTRQLEQRQKVAEGLRDVMAYLNHRRSFDDILAHIIGEAKQLLDTDGAIVFVRDESGDAADDESLRPTLSVDRGERYVQWGRLAAQRAISSRQPAVLQVVPCSDYCTCSCDEEIRQARSCTLSSGTFNRALVAIPLQASDRIHGAIVFLRSTEREFRQDEIEILASMAVQIALARENNQLYLAAEQTAIAEERARLARELHDSVTQSLFSLKLYAEAGYRAVRNENLERAKTCLAQLIETTTQAHKELRLLLHELRPAALAELGLVGALRQRLQAVEERAGVGVTFASDQTLSLPPAVEEGIYRITQEALNNVFKHADARHVALSLTADDTQVVLTIGDDGRGCDFAALQGNAGMGMSNMRQRAEKLGGTFQLASAPGGGTTIVVAIPTSVWQESWTGMVAGDSPA